MINITQISTKIEELPIEELANQTNFSVHKDNELSAKSFIMGFFLMLTSSSHNNTLNCWVEQISLLLKRVFSPSALRSKLQYRQVNFVETLLNHVLQKQLYQGTLDHLRSGPLLTFPRVFLEDSMCVKLPSNLFSIFPGAHSKTGQAATARIQCRIDLKSGRTTKIAIQSYRDNDQKFSKDIFHTLQAGDLVIRDLGYWSLKVFRLINWMNAFFLTRYQFGTNLYNVETEEQINLHNLLKEAKKENKQIVDLQVLVGKKEKLPARLVAIRVPQAIEQERRRKALKNRNKRVNYSDEYMDLLAFTIFITNVPPSIWEPKQLLKVYGYRWRIEIIFKAWKSHFNFEYFFKTKQQLSAPRAEITIRLLLIWILLFFVRLFNFFLSQVYRKKQKFVSILKFARFFKDHFKKLVRYFDKDFYIELVAKYCTYQKRKGRCNFYESLGIVENKIL